MTAAPLDDLIDVALQRVLPGFAAAPRKIRYAPLEGGIGRRSFVVTVGARRYVLRVPAPGSLAMLDVEAEAEVMRAAAAAGLAPPIVGADSASGLLLTEYAAGAVPWSAERAREPVNIERAAALLRALHALPVVLPRLAAAPVASGYVTELGELTADLAGLSEELVQLANGYDAHHHQTVLCHNDLVAANVLDDGELKLVDFEYAVGGAPILDLASLAGMNDYSPIQCEALAAAYYRGAAPFSPRELARIVRMTRLMGLFWALRGERHAADAAAYARLGAHLRKTLD